jgi:hypothetical protein
MKKEAVKALRKWKRTKIDKNSFLEARGGKEQRRKGVEDRNKKNFFGENVIRNPTARRTK